MFESEPILAVGDLHGMHGVLKRMLDELLPTLPTNIRLVFVGDYIDRGPDSSSVVEDLIQLKRQRPNTVFLMGNHEAMLLDAVGAGQPQPFIWNGGYETLDSYGLGPAQIDKIPAEHMAFFRDLQYLWATDDYIFVHAGLRPGVAIKDQDLRDLVWIREDFYLSGADFGRKVIFGHTPFHKPLITDTLIGIDTGAVYGNKLTCLQLPDMKLHFLDCSSERR